jgi:hypothetical protein
MENSQKFTSQSRKFMIKFFDKLKTKDLKSDNCLKIFRDSYEKEKKLQVELSMFDFYIEYLLRNQNYNINEKYNYINTLCNNIKTAIFDAPLNTTQITTNTVGSTKTIKINKPHALSVISDFIKTSRIIIYENPDETITQYDEDFRTLTTNNIINEIKEDGGVIPIANKNKEFNRRNDMIKIWKDTELKCVKFIENDTLANVLKKVYFLNASIIKLYSNESVTTLSCEDTSGKNNEEIIKDINTTIDDDNSNCEYIPREILIPKWIHKKYNTIINLLPTNALTETMIRNKQKIKCALICSGSQMIPGGCADQGVETNESILYYSSSYNLCINQLVMVYPLSQVQLLVLPNILVFKDHTKPNYPILPPIDGQKISVILSPVVYRPSTNIKNQDNYNIDKRLKLPSTLYDNPEKIIEHIKCILNTALFFGYDTIVLDDGGIVDFWLPVHHTISLTIQVINEYKGKFKEIVLAIDKKYLFDIYKKYID